MPGFFKNHGKVISITLIQGDNDGENREPREETGAGS